MTCSRSVVVPLLGRARLLRPRPPGRAQRPRRHGAQQRRLGDLCATSTERSPVHLRRQHHAPTSRQGEVHSDDGSLTATRLSSPQSRHDLGRIVSLSFAWPPTASRDTSDGSVEVVVPKDGTAYNVIATTATGAKDVGADRSELCARDEAEHRVTVRSGCGTAELTAGQSKGAEDRGRVRDWSGSRLTFLPISRSTAGFRAGQDRMRGSARGNQHKGRIVHT